MEVVYFGAAVRGVILVASLTRNGAAVMCRLVLSRLVVAVTLGLVLGPLLASCGGGGKQPPELNAAEANKQLYRIGPGDMLKVFVWGNPGLTDTVPVRPDGRISIPLIEDLEVANKTPTEAGRMIEQKLAAFVENPLVTVIVTEFVGPPEGSVRVVGEATQPKSIPYRTDMSLLDVMIEVGGLTEFAAGNRATLISAYGGRAERVPCPCRRLAAWWGYHSKCADAAGRCPDHPGELFLSSAAVSSAPTLAAGHWALSRGTMLLWRQWQAEEAVVFNRGSGGTHLLDAFSAACLRCIAAEPCSLEMLARYLGELSGAGDEQIRSRLDEVLNSLQQLNLAEPVQKCGLAI